MSFRVDDGGMANPPTRWDAAPEWGASAVAAPVVRPSSVLWPRVRMTVTSLFPLCWVVCALAFAAVTFSIDIAGWTRGLLSLPVSPAALGAFAAIYVSLVPLSLLHGALISVTRPFDVNMVSRVRRYTNVRALLFIGAHALSGAVTVVAFTTLISLSNSGGLNILAGRVVAYSAYGAFLGVIYASDFLWKRREHVRFPALTQRRLFALKSALPSVWAHAIRIYVRSAVVAALAALVAVFIPPADATGILGDVGAMLRSASTGGVLRAIVAGLLATFLMAVRAETLRINVCYPVEFPVTRSGALRAASAAATTSLRMRSTNPIVQPIPTPVDARGPPLPLLTEAIADKRDAYMRALAFADLAYAARHSPARRAEVYAVTPGFAAAETLLAVFTSCKEAIDALARRAFAEAEMKRSDATLAARAPSAVSPSLNAPAAQTIGSRILATDSWQTPASPLSPSTPAKTAGPQSPARTNLRRLNLQRTPAAGSQNTGSFGSAGASVATPTPRLQTLTGSGRPQNSVDSVLARPVAAVRNLVFAMHPRERFAAVFADVHTDICAIDAVSMLCACSIGEDRYGLVQSHLRGILESLVRCLSAVETVVRAHGASTGASRSGYGLGVGIAYRSSRDALDDGDFYGSQGPRDPATDAAAAISALQSAIYRITTAFAQYLTPLYLKDMSEPAALRLQSFKEFME